MTAGFVLFYMLIHISYVFFLITIYKPLISYCFMKCEVLPNKNCEKNGEFAYF